MSFEPNTVEIIDPANCSNWVIAHCGATDWVGRLSAVDVAARDARSTDWEPGDVPTMGEDGQLVPLDLTDGRNLNDAYLRLADVFVVRRIQVVDPQTQAWAISPVPGLPAMREDFFPISVRPNAVTWMDELAHDIRLLYHTWQSGLIDSVRKNLRRKQIEAEMNGSA